MYILLTGPRKPAEASSSMRSLPGWPRLGWLEVH